MVRMSIDELHAFLEREFPEIGWMGVQIERVDQRGIAVRLPANPQNLRPGGTISGPAMMSLVDLGMYCLLLAQIGPVPLAVTTNLNIDFLRKPPPGDLRAEGELLKLGKRMAVGDFRVYGVGGGEPVARASLTYSIPPDRN
jgi:uncharacterized protein (TIGR00369 family)